VNFIIKNGKITHWLRAPNQPGDNPTKPSGPGGSTGTATSPGTNTVPPGTQTAPTPPQTQTVPTTPEPGTATQAGPKV
jgi:hypothetical protein